MTDIDAYIAARGRALGCKANGWRREWYRESMKGELTEMTLAQGFQLRGREPRQGGQASGGGGSSLMRASFDEMLDIAADETGETISALAEALDLAARIWSEENGRNI